MFIGKGSIAKRLITQCPSMNEWMNKMCYIHTMEYHSALKGRKF
jgi:hypothetical protein